jgi:hypothetical protein
MAARRSTSSLPFVFCQFCKASDPFLSFFGKTSARRAYGDRPAATRSAEVYGFYNQPAADVKFSLRKGSAARLARRLTNRSPRGEQNGT